MKIQQLFLASGTSVITLAAPAMGKSMDEISATALPDAVGKQVSVRGIWTPSGKQGAGIVLIEEPKPTVFVSRVTVKKTAIARPGKLLSTVSTSDQKALQALLKEGDTVVGEGKLENFVVHNLTTSTYIRKPHFFYIEECQITVLKKKH